MKIENTPEMFRCDHALCKHFATKEIVVGGYKKSLCLCTDHYLELMLLLKQDNKNQRQKIKEQATNNMID